VAIIHDPAFMAWEERAPGSLKGDPVWRFHAYRVSLFLLDLATQDVADVSRRNRTKLGLADQLIRSIASVSANIAEGLGRPTANDRIRYFGIAMGSLREGITWYRAMTRDLDATVADTRVEQLSELRRILIGAQRWLASRPDRARLM
jgi:four helix bundle protein